MLTLQNMEEANRQLRFQSIPTPITKIVVAVDLKKFWTSCVVVHLDMMMKTGIQKYS